jgi:hypothetical protein
MLFIGGPASGMEFDVPNFVNLFLIYVDPNGVICPVEINQGHVKGTEQHRYARFSMAILNCDYFIHDSLTVETWETIVTRIHEVTQNG